MPEPLLAVTNLNAFYGTAQILHDVSFELGADPVAVIGRNGMGKPTLCQAIMGLMPQASGSVRFAGAEVMGRPPYKIAGAGIGYVPQGRRLFPSLTVDEHLAMLARGTRNKRWTPDAVYKLFPRLAERRTTICHSASVIGNGLLAHGRAMMALPANEGSARSSSRLTGSLRNPRVTWMGSTHRRIDGSGGSA